MGKTNRKIPGALLLALSLTACLPAGGNVAWAEAVEHPPVEGARFPPVSVKAAALIDRISGQILLSREKDRRLPPASLTKVMTAVLALESGSLQDVVTIGAESVGQPAPKIGLKPGESLRSRTRPVPEAPAVSSPLPSSLEGMRYEKNQAAGNWGAWATREAISGLSSIPSHLPASGGG